MSALVCIASASALGEPDPAGDLQRAGEELAKNGQFADAIAKFKAAERLHVSAERACMIALTYARLEEWARADLWLSVCLARSSAGEALPPWAVKAQQQIHDGAAKLAAVEIVVQPADAKPLVSISTFAPDETFEPRTIHLPPGSHEIVVRAAGYRDAHERIEITDSAPRRVVIELQHVVPPPSPPPDRLPGRLALAGGIAIAAGAASYGVMGYAWWKLKDRTESQASYDRYHPIYLGARYATWGLWTAGIGLEIVGLLARHHGDETPAVTFAPAPAGGMFVVEWRH